MGIFRFSSLSLYLFLSQNVARAYDFGYDWMQWQNSDSDKIQWTRRKIEARRNFDKPYTTYTDTHTVSAYIGQIIYQTGWNSFCFIYSFLSVVIIKLSRIRCCWGELVVGRSPFFCLLVVFFGVFLLLYFSLDVRFFYAWHGLCDK